MSHDRIVAPIHVFLLADAGSVHTKMFVDHFCASPDVSHVSVLSFQSTSCLVPHSKLSLYRRPLNAGFSAFRKLMWYAFTVWWVMRFVAREKPDICHAHFATSYGIIAALSIPHRYLLSVWGSDVFVYPHQSSLWHRLVSYSLSRARRVLSTSHAMAKETQTLTSTPVEVTPFGIDVDRFAPQTIDHPIFSAQCTVIGTVKRLEEVAGVDILLEAFSLLTQQGGADYRLLIVGDGSQRDSLETLANSLGLSHYVHFTGAVKPDQVQLYHNQLDVAVYPSRHESFGVSILESMACECPIVASNVEGIPEVIASSDNGVIVNELNAEAFAHAITGVLSDNDRLRLGRNARAHVCAHYDRRVCMSNFLRIYKEFSE